MSEESNKDRRSGPMGHIVLMLALCIPGTIWATLQLWWKSPEPKYSLAICFLVVTLIWLVSKTAIVKWILDSEWLQPTETWAYCDDDLDPQAQQLRERDEWYLIMFLLLDLAIGLQETSAIKATPEITELALTAAFIGVVVKARHGLFRWIRERWKDFRIHLSTAVLMMFAFGFMMFFWLEVYPDFAGEARFSSTFFWMTFFYLRGVFRGLEDDIERKQVPRAHRSGPAQTPIQKVRVVIVGLSISIAVLSGVMWMDDTGMWRFNDCPFWLNLVVWVIFFVPAFIPSIVGFVSDFRRRPQQALGEDKAK